jgi:hypothetical protein
MTHVDIVIEIAFFEGAVGKDHLAITMLDTFDPLTNVATSISPSHLTMAVSFVVLVFSFIVIATSPLKFTLSTFFIFNVLSLVFILWTS